MQKFDNKRQVTIAGLGTIETLNASKLPFGKSLFRFFPVSEFFYDGADDIMLVQKQHWLKSKKLNKDLQILCPSASFNYLVDERQEKPVIGKICKICEAKKVFNVLSKKEDVSERDKTWYNELAKKLTPKSSGASIGSFCDRKGEMETPVILRYGKELLSSIEKAVIMYLKHYGVNIANPQNGFLFEINVTKDEQTQRRTYSSSDIFYGNDKNDKKVHVVDLTNLQYDWKEVSQAIKGEIMSIPSSEKVEAFFKENAPEIYKDFITNNSVEPSCEDDDTLSQDMFDVIDKA